MSRCFCLLPHLLGALCLLILLAAPNTYGVHVYHQTTHFSSKHDLFGPVGGILYNSLELLIVWPNSSFSSYISIFSHSIVFLFAVFILLLCVMLLVHFYVRWHLKYHLRTKLCPKQRKKNLVLHDVVCCLLGLSLVPWGWNCWFCQCPSMMTLCMLELIILFNHWAGLNNALHLPIMSQFMWVSIFV